MNDGPAADEPARGAGDVDVTWSIDMPRELGVFKVDASDVGAPLPSATGAPRWGLDLGEGDRTHAAPVAGGGLLYVAIGNRVCVIAPAVFAGEMVGYYEFPADVDDRPAMRDGTLYATSAGHLWAVQSWDELPRITARPRGGPLHLRENLARRPPRLSPPA